MLSFLCEETATAYTHQALREMAIEQRIDALFFDAVCRELTLQAGYPRVINAKKFLDLLASDFQKDPVSLAQRYHLFLWKLQGTDGVRGLVSSPHLPFQKALFQFLQKKVLTPDFCYLYAKAFGKMLENQGLFSERKILAFAEDGRDFFGHQGLKQAILAALTQEGIRVQDLGILPTPFLAKYSLQNEMGAIMLTASHNPSSYNGIKVFVKGKKLYPRGPLGEYCLSGYFLGLCDNRFTFNEDIDFTSVETISVEQESLRWLLGEVSPLPIESLQKSPLLLDMANGAYSSIACNFFTQLGIPFMEVACTPGNQKINTGCGVGVLEELESEVPFSEGLPQILLSLFAAGRKSETKKAYGIVLDGDGDRAFVLAYQGGNDSVRIYDGDDLGYLIAYSQNARYQGKERPLFVSTIESDANLALSVAKKLRWQTKTTCVGDRWLIEDEDQIGQPFLGCERSGHLIFPLLVAVEGKDRETGTLCTGNGLLTALVSLTTLMENEPNAVIFPHGFRSSISKRTERLQGFYRDAPLWNTFFTEIQKSFPWVCTEQLFTQEPDMIFFGFTCADSIGVGHCYMRKSGTEPKISICVSVGEASRESAKEGIGRLHLLLDQEF